MLETTRSSDDDVWDTHVHILDPAKFPYTGNRTYTPAPALPEQLVKRSTATSFLVVQASVEDSSDSTLTHVAELNKQHANLTFRAEIVYEEASADDGYTWSHEHLDQLHAAGVRCLRIRNPKGVDDRDVATKVQRLLEDKLGRVARHKGWPIAMQLPLKVWSLLGPTIERMCNLGTRIIAEHCAGVRMPLTADDKVALDSFVELLRRLPNLYVKFGALHRRYDPETGGTLEQLCACLRTMAVATRGQLLWGSDWPHVDSSVRGDRTAEAPHLIVDEGAELQTLREWLDAEAVRRMLSDTPRGLFEL